MSEPSLSNLRAELAADPADISIAGRLIDLASTPADLPAAQEALSAIEAASSVNAEDLGVRYMLGTAQQLQILPHQIHSTRTAPPEQQKRGNVALVPHMFGATSAYDGSQMNTCAMCLCSCIW